MTTHTHTDTQAEKMGDPFHSVHDEILSNVIITRPLIRNPLLGIFETP